MITERIIPKSIQSIDFGNTLEILRTVENKLVNGDLKGVKEHLEPLQSKLNRDSDANTNKFLGKIQARLDVMELIEVLMGYNNSRFKDVIS